MKNNRIKRFNENSELNNSSSQKINWDEFIEDLRRDMGSNTSIKTTDFRYLEKWLFDKILNKTVIGDEFWERPNW